MSCIAIHSDATMPYKGSDKAAGYDLSSVGEYTIPPGERQVVSTGLRIICPDGTYGRIAPRSGLAVKAGIDTMAGVIDADYRGEVGVVLVNLGKETFKVTKGMRVAQIIFEKYDDMGGVRGLKMVHEDAEEAVTVRGDTGRGEGGFGSTGTSAPQFDAGQMRPYPMASSAGIFH